MQHHGPGILTEHQKLIFDRFYRVDEGRSRGMGGAGLGLAIAKWAVEANGGEIALVPSATGASFRISLPLSSRAANPAVEGGGKHA